VVLSRSEARAFYDGFGKKQDAQGFYEDPALDRLIAHADFEHADRIFELGCGTGRFAARLFSDHLLPVATYLGVDLSATMTHLASERLTTVGSRAQVVQTDGSMRIPLPDGSVDRVISTYVLDLLSDTDIQEVVREAHRVLKPGGKLGLVSLSEGVTWLSRLLVKLWTILYRLNARLVGGCRPIHLDRFLDPGRWNLAYRQVVVSFGVPSEVIVAEKREGTGAGA
jgi:ubiquinone/menaquinone biosynthesis C-methylase UbiE